MSARGASLRLLIGVLTVLLGGLLWAWAIQTSGPPARPESDPNKPVGLLFNAGDRVAFTFSGLGTERGFEESGGNLGGVELDGHDLDFGSMTTFLDRSFPRQGRYSRLDPLPNGLVASGLDSGNPDIEVETRWSVVPAGDPRVLGQLSVETTVTNRGQVSVEDYALGDIISWGALEHFAPGPGTDLAGKDVELAWVGASGERGAILVAGAQHLTGPHGSSWSDPVWTTASLLPGESASIERQVLVGMHLGDLVGRALQLQGRETTSLDLHVEEDSSGEDVSGAGLTVHVLTDAGESEPLCRARTDRQGNASVDLEPGRYRIEANAAARRSPSPIRVDVGPEGGDPVRLKLSRPGALDTRIWGPGDTPLPARIDFEGLDSTPDPVLGPSSRSKGLNRAYVLGTERVRLPPGRYRATISHGPAWSIGYADIEVAPLQSEVDPASLDMHLRPLVQPSGWAHCDFHQHASYSPDSAVPPVEGLIASAAEGLNCIATTDHDAVADWGPHLADAGMQDSMTWLPGIEVTSEAMGHYNAFPWDPSLGIVAHRGQTSKQIVAAMRQRAPDALVQLNHPLWGAIGLWNLVGLDPETGRPRVLDDAGMPTGAAEDFDLIEILSGKDTEHSEKTLQAWLKLLGATGGEAPRPVGNSDSHRLVGQERGASRTWLNDCLGGGLASAESVVAAIRAGCRHTASTGPFLDLRMAPHPSDQATPVEVEVEMLAPEWMPVDELELYAGGPAPSASRSLGQWSPGLPPLSTSTAGGATRWLLELSIPNDGTTEWVVAVVRGNSPMLPWSEAVALAVTGPLTISP